ncbi:EpsG family protein [Solibacillus ferritrahens]|uniref:EpsG family protein n=1 Tax=Solibacillus ferritrahens TaxID=3098620 RepID=UPI00300B829D
MENTIELSRSATLSLYFSSIILAIIFAYLSEQFKVFYRGKVRINPFYWMLSFLSLWIPLGFRGYGIDHEAYVNMYYNIRNTYSWFPEPLYALLNYVISVTLSNFIYIYLISSFISLFFIYLAFANRLGKNSLYISVMILSISYYFYMYGLVRMFIAVGIVMYAHKFIEERKPFKYIIWCIVASGFHYSALIMIPLYFVFTYKIKENYSFKDSLNNLLMSIFIVPMVFLVGSKIFIMIFGGVSFFARYANYFQLNLTVGSLKNFAWAWPLLILVMLFGKLIIKKVEDGNILIRMFWVFFSLSIISIFFPVFRIGFFLFYIGFYLYASLPKLLSKNDKIPITYTYTVLFFLIGFYYIYSVFFDSIFIDPYLIPYFWTVPY